MYYYWNQCELYGDFIRRIIQKRRMLNTLMIYTLQIFQGYTDRFSQVDLTELFRYVETNERIPNYEIKQFRRYCLFSKKTF